MDDNALLSEAVRALGTAWRALRLYPPSSPLPLEAVEAACKAVDAFLQAEPSLRLVVTRKGFVVRGLDDVFAPPGAPEIADALGCHGIAEVHFVAPPMAEELAAMLGAAALGPEELRGRGGMQSVLGEAGPGTIRVVAVALATNEALIEIPEEEADKFLAELAGDSARLAVWLRAVLTYDDESLADGLLELARAAGDPAVFGRSLAKAFIELEMDSKDRLLEVAIGLEPVRRISVEMLDGLTVGDVSAAIRGGRYGTNPMATSWALTSLPIGERFDELVAEVEASLAAADRSEAEIAFVRRMIAARRSDEPERALADAVPAYRSLLQAAALSPEHVSGAGRDATARRELDERGVDTVLALLDSAEDLGAYSSVLQALSRAVPHLVERGRLDLAVRLVRDMSARSADSSKGWPELDSRLGRAVSEACGPRTMAALLEAADESAIGAANELVNLGGDAAATSLADAAMASPADDSMRWAERVLGRRLPELLANGVAGAEARHAAALAEVFARDGGPRCLQALDQLVSRPEDHVRRETARGIPAGGGRAVPMFMPRLLRDESQDVAMVAAHTLGRHAPEGSVEILAARLDDLEGDKDIGLAREIVSVLAKSPGEAAGSALSRLAKRRSMFGRGRFTQVRRLARQALDSRSAEGVA